MQIDLKALFFLSQAAARQMVLQGEGKIINVASMLSFQGGILVPSYTAAKSGVAGLTRALGNEWAAQWDQCQCNSPRLYGNGQYCPAARRSGEEQSHPGAHSRRPLG